MHHRNVPPIGLPLGHGNHAAVAGPGGQREIATGNPPGRSAVGGGDPQIALAVHVRDPVEIEGEQIRLVGRGIWVDMEAKIFKVLHNVKTRWSKGERG